ncbi:hypothetical protein [Planococcus wigleyi]|uniref:Uncharacterized protein n=1 Tax=Planococcus wigleyi TaxID=2762216 RepID=A0ABR8WA42_9BACL|nr:hypothetical protein [Planococcus wigleyi]MBD8013900.1 hypothetical protein [Planococcus wigleyi]
MFKTVEEHGLLINENILPRLEKVENIQNETKSELKDVKTEIQGVKTEVTAVRNAQSSMELTVLKDGQHTRDLLNQFVNHYFATDGKVLESQEKMMESKEKVTLRKLSKSEKISIAFIGMLSGGGLVAVSPVIIHFLDAVYK